VRMGGEEGVERARWEAPVGMRGVRVERPRMYSSKRKHQGIPVSALL
jgi:hypothetical protein